MAKKAKFSVVFLHNSVFAYQSCALLQLSFDFIAHCTFDSAQFNCDF